MNYILYGIIFYILISCDSDTDKHTMEKVIFLHHSTGEQIWIGKTNRYIYKFTKRGDVQKYFHKNNRGKKSKITISNLVFPKEKPYGWKNYPYDYYNIWVKNAGTLPYLQEPTLEILTKEYDVIIFKHCYPVSNIMKDTGSPNIDSDEKRIENYKVQYNELKVKMHEFPNNKFIVWTPAIQVKNKIDQNQALRTQQFYKWMINEWDEKDDNIFIWDFYKLETEGGIYLLDEYAVSHNNSHPNPAFSARVASEFSQFVIEIAEGNN